MEKWKRLAAQVAWSGLLVSGFAAGALPVVAQEAAIPKKGASVTSTSSSNQDQAKVDELPDSPGASRSKSEEQVPIVRPPGTAASGLQMAQAQSPPGLSTQTQSSQTPSTQTQPNQDNPQTNAQEPVGTAAAEASHATGVAASQPAGVAIAPARQHRVRTIVIRVGAIVGAGVAVGSVIALSEATSSKPPGAH